MKVDLHIHSSRSDGKYPPSQVVQYCVKSHLNVISLTDHDTVDGVREARRSIQQLHNLTLISGVELSTYLDEDELHILGYGIDETHPRMRQILHRAQTSRRQRVVRILEQLHHVGIPLTIQDITNRHQTISLGRMHIARMLVQGGYVRTLREAFDRYLSYDINGLRFSSEDFISSCEAIATILDAGGIPVFAHPTIPLFDRYIDPLIEAGLQGVEVFKGSRSAIEEYYLETVVKDKGLFATGGSDWHGYHTTQCLGNFFVDAERIRPFLDAVRLIGKE